MYFVLQFLCLVYRLFCTLNSISSFVCYAQFTVYYGSLDIPNPWGMAIGLHIINLLIEYIHCIVHTVYVTVHN